MQPRKRITNNSNNNINNNNNNNDNNKNSSNITIIAMLYLEAPNQLEAGQKNGDGHHTAKHKPALLPERDQDYQDYHHHDYQDYHHHDHQDHHHRDYQT